MPMDRKLYPKDWEAIALAIKEEVNWQCEECGRPCRRPGESDCDLEERIDELLLWRSDLFDEVWDEEHGRVSIPRFGRFTLTVAHLNHRPEECDRANLRAWCSVCHCRYDLKAMATKRRLKQERQGQLTLFA